MDLVLDLITIPMSHGLLQTTVESDGLKLNFTAKKTYSC